MSQYESLSEQAKRLRESYPPGTRIELINMNDPYPVPPGTKGTVIGVDDGAHILMNWDDGRTLSLVPGEDAFRRIDDSPGETEQNTPVFGGM